MTDWHAQAACRDMDVAAFFPPYVHVRPGRRPRGHDPFAVVRPVCESCPVRLLCLEENLDTPEGFFGGKDPDERAEILLRMRRGA